MTETDNTPIAEAPAKTGLHRHLTGWRGLVAAAFVLAATAWVAMIFNEYVSMACAAAGLVASVVATCKVGRGVWRDLAITFIIACAVLLVVYAAFFGGVSAALKSL